MIQALTAGWAQPRLHRLGPRRERRSQHALPIDVCAHRFGYLPLRFQSLGVLHSIYHIERVWERRGRGVTPSRRYFAVRCDDQQHYVLCQDVTVGTWYLVGAMV